MRIDKTYCNVRKIPQRFVKGLENCINVSRLQSHLARGEKKFLEVIIFCSSIKIIFTSQILQ